MNFSPITLESTYVRVEPLAQKHCDDLFLASQYSEIWELMITPAPKTRDEMRTWIEISLEQVAAGTHVWFAIVQRADNRAVGVTSYMSIARADRGLEIGGTWLTPSTWRTAINTECKYLLLRHAFEELRCIRVQLKTDERNLRSQRAIERLGAVKEGVLRKYQISQNNFPRNTVMYSIVDSEWSAVKKKLESFLNKPQNHTETHGKMSF
ncbi:MAG: GNAT family N-acetyltransferase [Chloroflexi bacterium]|nr:GNAT family N-acetyltransferase [Chloroflexota bacterium]